MKFDTHVGTFVHAEFHSFVVPHWVEWSWQELPDSLHLVYFTHP